MIPGAFAYHRPTSVADAVALLADLGDDARPLAGGHSLIPMMKLRLASPAHLVDLAGIADLKGIRADGDDVVIGAMTTQHELIGSDLLAAKGADPARDLAADRRPAGALCRHHRRQRRQRRSRQRHAGGDDVPRRHLPRASARPASAAFAARDFYQGAYFTALEPGEVLTAIRIPVPPAGHGYAYEKLKRKIGDYATAAAAVVLTMSGGKVATCSIGLTNVGRDAAVWPRRRRTILLGSTLDAATVKRAVAAAEAITSPAADARGPAALPHQDGRRDARARARARHVSARAAR